MVLYLLAEGLALFHDWLLVAKVTLSHCDPIQELNQCVNATLGLLLKIGLRGSKTKIKKIDIHQYSSIVSFQIKIYFTCLMPNYFSLPKLFMSIKISLHLKRKLHVKPSNNLSPKFES